MKIKSFLISGILGLVCIFNFSSANNYNGLSYSCYLGTPIEGYNQCDDDYLNFNPYIEGDYILSASSSVSFNAIALVENGHFENSTNTLDPGTFPGTYNLYCTPGGGGCHNINIYDYNNVVGEGLITFTVSQAGGGGEGGEGGEGGGIITNGISAFGGIVDKLGNITTEFVPYLIYIFIGILGISLIINVVKYILGYLKGQSTSVVKTPYDREGMKARRTRRRRNRRFGKYLKKNYSEKPLKFGSQGYNSWRE